ncbi:mechanosensitive ion channel family protein [Rhizobium sp. KVB221]|uniref:Mechanosensitive ion channel family protein n=2 Tax=Rhizobium setariae TaxID=2801340 RepID=A0A936YKP7_9HYPH|nr:mechanosensitive ion channel family protein [Rhizobium setariae]
MLTLSGAIAFAQQAPAPPPEKISELIRLLDDPTIRDWLKTQQQTQAKPVESELEPGIEQWEANARSSFRQLFRAIPTVPSEFAAAAGRVRSEAASSGFMSAASSIAIVLLVSFLGEWAVRSFIRRTANESLLLKRTYMELVPLVAFILIVAAAFLSIDWPHLMHSAILFYLLAVVAFRIVASASAMALSAGSLSTFMYRRVLLFSAILLLSIATARLAQKLSVPPDTIRAASFLATIVLLGLCCEAVWRHPDPSVTPVRTRLVRTAYFVALWLLWSCGFRVLFWACLYAVALPKILPAVDRFAKAFVAARWPDQPEHSIRTVLVVRGVRAVIFAAAVAWLAVVWQYNPQNLGREISFLDTIIRGLFVSMIVLLVFDLGWSLTKALIDRKLESVRTDGPLPPEEAARRARLRTLLPIFRNGLAAVFIVVAALMVLAELGVQIGPLIAGAGIFGVAIGFGSQTLVKDVISGVLYLMDDAFRVGEYIQSGSYKGTVESFSLRSIRLRHHRGPVFTVPFGELGAVQNMSRDWAIDKFLLRVTFDADIAKAKKLVKAIGAELLEDPEVGPEIIETLKMKGVEQISEYGIELAFAFMAKPGYQSMIRRRAYTMIRQAFKENGIEFAQPTIQVGGEDKAENAAVASAIAAQKKLAEATAAAAEQ